MKRRPFNPELAVGAAGPEPPRPAPGAPMTVSQVTRLVKEAIEAALSPSVWVCGELSNAKRHGSGHFYFTLKDDRSELSCVMWRSDAARLKFDPTDGMAVVVRGTVGVYERTGRYQLYARTMEPRGVGALEIAFRQMCEKLKAEGLFEEDRKKPLPRYPERIAVVTSESGAAIQDILDTLKRRYPCAEVVLLPVPVQGPGAASAVARAIRAVNEHSKSLGGVDVMIVGRGGGSAEDLWSFNEEVVARAIYDSRIPVISAVGHETDVTVADFVADRRAATPTAAAELATPERLEVIEELAFRESSLARSLRHRAGLARSRFDALARHRLFAEPLSMVMMRRTHLDKLHAALALRIHESFRVSQRRLGDLLPGLQRLHPQRRVSVHAAQLSHFEHRLRMALNRQAAEADRGFEAVAGRYARLTAERVLGSRVEDVGAVDRRLRLAVGQLLRHEETRIHNLKLRLQALSYRSTLARGYSITRLKDGKILRSVSSAREGDRLVTEVGDGTLESRVIDGNQGDLFD